MRKNKEKYVLIRKVVQILSFLFILFLISSEGRLAVKIFNPSIYFKIDPLIMISTSIAERVIFDGLFFSFILILLTFLFGRFFCGWLCPMGIFFDFILWLKNIFIRKRKNTKTVSEKLRYIKYILMFVVIVISFTGIQISWFFDPVVIFVRTFTFNIFPVVTNFLNYFLSVFVRWTDYFEPLDRVYATLKQYIFSSVPQSFVHSLPVFVIFLVIVISTIYISRFWCRYLCPLGALLAIPARFSPFRRYVYSCRDTCDMCEDICRMSAIKKDNIYKKEECILCLDCIAYCPNETSYFGFRKEKIQEESKGAKISRRDFLTRVLSTIFFITGCSRVVKSNNFTELTSVIRPPGSISEEKFVNRCIRCGNCMRVCMTNCLQPCILESGFSGIWTPRIDTDIGYCEYKCTRCTEVCPTGAIKPVTQQEKENIKLGVAKIDKEKCISYISDETCLVCEEHCPVHGKAIKLTSRKTPNGQIIKMPVVDVELCIGCGLCAYVCPAKPQKAIKIFKY